MQGSKITFETGSVHELLDKLLDELMEVVDTVIARKLNGEGAPLTIMSIATEITQREELREARHAHLAKVADR